MNPEVQQAVDWLKASEDPLSIDYKAGVLLQSEHEARMKAERELHDMTLSWSAAADDLGQAKTELATAKDEIIPDLEEELRQAESAVQIQAERAEQAIRERDEARKKVQMWKDCFGHLTSDPDFQ